MGRSIKSVCFKLKTRDYYKIKIEWQLCVVEHYELFKKLETKVCLTIHLQPHTLTHALVHKK
jgi:hypothetical protein